MVFDKRFRKQKEKRDLLRTMTGPYPGGPCIFPQCYYYYDIYYLSLLFVNNNNMNRIVFTWSLCDCLFVSSSFIHFCCCFFNEQTNGPPPACRSLCRLLAGGLYRSIFLNSLSWILDPGFWILDPGTYVAYVNIRISLMQKNRRTALQ